MEILIIDTTIVNFGDDRGGQVVEAPEFVDVSKDTAQALVRSGRGLYTSRANDPEKGAPNTATAEMIKAAQAEIKRRSQPAQPDAPAAA